MVRATLGKAHHQPQVGVRQFPLGAPAVGLAHRDRFERACKFAGRNLGPALHRLDRFLRRFDSPGDIKQILPAAVDLQQIAVFSRGRIVQKLPLTAARRFLVTLDQRM